MSETAIKAFITQPELARRLGRNIATIRAWQARGLIPKAIHLTPRMAGWWESDLNLALERLQRQANER